MQLRICATQIGFLALEGDRKSQAKKEGVRNKRHYEAIIWIALEKGQSLDLSF